MDLVPPAPDGRRDSLHSVPAWPRKHFLMNCPPWLMLALTSGLHHCPRFPCVPGNGQVHQLQQRAAFTCLSVACVILTATHWGWLQLPVPEPELAERRSSPLSLSHRPNKSLRKSNIVPRATVCSLVFYNNSSCIIILSISCANQKRGENKNQNCEPFMFFK